MILDICRHECGLTFRTFSLWIQEVWSTIYDIMTGMSRYEVMLTYWMIGSPVGVHLLRGNLEKLQLSRSFWTGSKTRNANWKSSVKSAGQKSSFEWVMRTTICTPPVATVAWLSWRVYNEAVANSCQEFTPCKRFPATCAVSRSCASGLPAQGTQMLHSKNCEEERSSNLFHLVPCRGGSSNNSLADRIVGREPMTCYSGRSHDIWHSLGPNFHFEPGLKLYNLTNTEKKTHTQTHMATRCNQNIQWLFNI